MVGIRMFVDQGLGHSSYLIDLGDGTAAIIDPPRFPTGHVTAAEAQCTAPGWTIDTHSHADCVTGSPALDVRQRNEYDTGHVPDTINIELGSLAYASVPDGPVTVMCGHGERAMTGASILASRGHHDVSVLDGGPDTWAEWTGHPLAVDR